jgi:hypothetical protein
VREWLEQEGLGEYAPNFEKMNISGAEVPYLADRHLKEMGIAKVGPRIRILKACKNFKRTLKNWERNEVVIDVMNWHLRPRSLVFFPTRYKFTPAAIIVHDPRPLECGYVIDRIDVSTIIDINMMEFMGFLGFVPDERTLSRRRLTLRDADTLTSCRTTPNFLICESNCGCTSLVKCSWSARARARRSTDGGALSGSSS